MTKVKIIFSIMTLTIIFLLGFIIYCESGMREARFGRFSRPPKMERIIKLMKRDLDITDEQVIKITAIHEKYRNEIEKRRLETEKEMCEVKDLMKEKEFDEKKTRAILKKIEAKKVEENLLIFKMRFEEDKILTEKQLAKRKEIANKKMCRRFPPL